MTLQILKLLICARTLTTSRVVVLQRHLVECLRDVLVATLI